MLRSAPSASVNSLKTVSKKNARKLSIKFTTLINKLYQTWHTFINIQQPNREPGISQVLIEEQLTGRIMGHRETTMEVNFWFQVEQFKFTSLLSYTALSVAAPIDC